MTHINFSKLTTILVLTGMLFIQGCASKSVASGVLQGNVAPCPSSPNCVSSADSDEDRYFEPLKYNGTKEQAKERLISVLGDMKNTKVVSDRNSYLRAEFKTDLLGFVDDGEFYIVDGVINVRSASRTGYSDFGKNRKRMETIKEAFEPCCN